jgi:hypothetical protein
LGEDAAFLVPRDEFLGLRRRCCCGSQLYVVRGTYDVILLCVGIWWNEGRRKEEGGLEGGVSGLSKSIWVFRKREIESYTTFFRKLSQ